MKKDLFEKLIIEKKERWISVKVIEEDYVETFLIIGEENTKKLYQLLEELKKL